MREMKDSGVEWIGEIPIDWAVSKIKFVAKSNLDTLSEDTAATHMIDYIDIGSVTYTNGIELVQRFSFDEAPSRARRIVHTGDTIISTVRTYLKAVAYIENKYDSFVASTGFSVLTPNQGLNTKYLYYAISSHSFISEVESNSVGISYPAINDSVLIDLKSVFPALKIQHHITDYLDAKCAQIDRVIARQQEIIEKLKEYKLSVITEAVTKGLNPDVSMKDSGIEWIGKIPEAWDTKKLKYVARFQTGATPSSNNPELFEGDFLWYTPADFNSLVLNSSSRTISDDAIKNGSVPVYPAKSVLFVGIGATTGKIGFSEKDCSSNQQITAIISGMDMEGKFAAYFLTSVANIIRGNAQFTTLPIVNNKELADIVIVSPPLNEQKAIMKHLDSKCSKIEESITTKKIIIDKLIEYKKSLIYEVVTGKREV